MMMDTWAVIDIGTNSVRLLIAQIWADQIRADQMKPLFRQTVIARLGEGMKGTILPRAGERVMNVLKEFRRLIANYEPEHIRLVGTQFLREADNAAEFRARVLEELGWDLEILSGVDEARLSYLGATRNLRINETPVVLDIGGGSTEIMLSPEVGVSMPIGVLRLFEQPMTSKNVQIYLKERLETFTFPDDMILIGVGGTCTTLGAIQMQMREYDPDQVSGLVLTRSQINKIEERMLALTLQQRLEIPGMIPGREDLLPSGAALLLDIMYFLHCEDMMVQDADLLFGAIGEDGT